MFSALPSTNGICVFDIVSVIFFLIQNEKPKTQDWNEVGSLGEGRSVPTTSKVVMGCVDEPYSFSSTFLAAKGFAHTIELHSTITLAWLS